MKEIVKNKKRLILALSILFVVTAVILRFLPSNIGDFLSYIVFPIYFFACSIIYWKVKKYNLNIPMFMMLLYLFFGYLIIGNLMSPLKVLLAFIAGFIPLMVIKAYYRFKWRRLSKEELKFSDKSRKIVSYFLPLAIFVVLEFYFSITTFQVATFPTGILATIIGVILVYSFYYIILFISRSTKKATIILGIILLVIFIINEGRIYYTSDALILSDLLLIKSAGEVASFDVTFFNCLHFLLFSTIVVSIILIWFFSIADKTESRLIYDRRNTIRLIGAFLIIIILIVPSRTKDKFITRNIYNIHDGYDLAINASNTRYYKRYGVISGMYGKLIESRRIMPDGYSKKELKRLIASTPKNEGKWNKPNIIVIFSESFWDIGKVDGIKFDKDVVSNFNRLKNEGITVEMISPSYGGISSNVEFEILTGGSLNYFSKGYTTYLQLFKQGISEDNPSIIQELRNNGYKTKILNSSSKTMFNCDEVYDIYDVDERNHLYDEIDLDGNYVTDAYLTDRIIEYFDNKPKDEKIFFFTITMGGHMPYYEERYDDYDVNIVDSKYDKDVNEVIHSYAEGIYLADQELGRLYDYIQTLDEDTIVVFFGDHLPHLTTPDGKDALFTTGYLSDDYNLESVYKQFNTTALILSNYELENDDPKYLSPDLLMTYVLNNMDIELSPFYRWLYTTREVLPSSNNVVSQDKDGKIYFTLALEDKMKEMYDLRDKVQYMLFK